MNEIVYRKCECDLVFYCNYSFIHTHINVSIVNINTSIIVYLKLKEMLNS